MRLISSNLNTHPHLIKEIDKKNILKVIFEEVIWKQKAYILSH